MKSFIGDLAERLLRKYQDPRNLTIIFPNRRAGLFLQKELGKRIEQPIWLPKILSLEDFILSHSQFEKIESFESVLWLHEVYLNHKEKGETLDKFFFWGEMIIKDFEEIDQYGVDAYQLFTSIKSQKELDQEFYFLSEEDKKIITSFWATFLPKSSKNQDLFLETWKILKSIYTEYKSFLAVKGKAYIGMIYADFLEHLLDDDYSDDGHLIFVGFNALTAVEEQIVKYYVEYKGAEMLWDTDAYYLQDISQEAGHFHRMYRKDRILGKTFESQIPNHVADPKSMTAIGVSLEVGQAKALGEKLSILMLEPYFKPENVVIVLPNEYMLFPVLHALPKGLKDINITMGFPLKETPIYSLLESILMLQNMLRPTLDDYIFYYKPVISILEHPLIYDLDVVYFKEFNAKIRKYNLVFVSSGQIPLNSPLLKLIFSKPDNPLDYLLEILKTIHEQSEIENGDLDREFTNKYYQHIFQLRAVLRGEQEALLSYEFLIQLFQKISRSLKIPFSGEPLRGIQIMGILETRNLDFEHVFILSMNENAWPASPKRGSFIPHNIRKAFDLPTHEHQDAIYAYLFYRLLQRSREVVFYYNTISEFNMNGELSRLVRQLELESGHSIEKKILANPIALPVKKEISVKKDYSVMKKLSRYTRDFKTPYMSRLTPSALDTYLYCKLRFYYKYVAELYEEDQIQEELDALIFGNILHDAMEILYRQFMIVQKTAVVDAIHFFWLREGVDGAINEAFQKHYQIKGDKKKVMIEGRNIIAAEIIKKMINKILDIDEKYAPFKIIGLEVGTKEGFSVDLSLPVNGRKHVIGLKGKIDRIDLKGGVLRVIDYKTGKDEKTFETLNSLIDPENIKRNKTAFQIFFYSYLVQYGYKDSYERIEPSIFNSKQLFDDKFDWRLIQKEKG
ncbi:MAG: Inactivated superfamily I helicase, partial [Flammeovirgaceae bacterium]|nr:Inactivated superfamily I helicase [Flammeovirgaceae bacterium]